MVVSCPVCASDEYVDQATGACSQHGHLSGANLEMVWISGGGSVYHAQRGCPGLSQGQAKVAARLGDVAQVIQETRESVARSRAPCRVCTPPSWRR